MANNKKDLEKPKKSSNPEKKIRPIPKDLEKIFGIEMSRMSFTNSNPIKEKINEEHISKLIDNDLLEKKSNRRYNLAYVIIGIFICIFSMVS